MLTTKQKAKILTNYRVHDKDTGSPDVQVALLTRQIDELTKHLKKNHKDNHSRRGLLKLVNQRRQMLDYLKQEDESRYAKLIADLGLRK